MAAVAPAPGPAQAGQGPEATPPPEATVQDTQDENQSKTKDDPEPPKPAPAAQSAKPAKGGQQPKADQPAGEKKLSGAELKKKAKEEKAARRAQAKAASGVAPQGPPGQQQGQDKGGKGVKPKQDAPSGSQSQRQAAKPVAAPAPPKETKPKVPVIFSHLSMAKRISLQQTDKDVDPRITLLGQQMAAFVVDDSTTRTQATLLAMKRVLAAYSTPQGTTFSRHFTAHVLNPQIDYLAACRPMCFSMGNAIRWLKLQISKVDIDLADFEAKRALSEAIDNYIRDKIDVAGPVIAEKTNALIKDKDTILTYGHHFLVERTLWLAKESGKDVNVIVIDDPFNPVGSEFAKRLRAYGFGKIKYSPNLGLLPDYLKLADLVLAGAEATFSNGAMYARAGTADVAMYAKNMNVKFVSLCETINYTERVSVDSLTYNEIDPEMCTEDGVRLLFDTVLPEHIHRTINEMGLSEPSSISGMLRKQEEQE
ncbi:initiation factor 2 subunit family protein [Emericellopsis atlantica]|uniref:Translation initiation factor eIF2B subunit delta n=1 Tax=Emericellopsis atlantica TaxID=2614577 RepID=A0A9P7ZF03_9HYPO|nr:initiation factor 2 subunit family protein [Emericellopsis atlantica]KAG9250898.1 initiation factor 2 subunit family protein [Emericellopsis atlantica]